MIGKKIRAYREFRGLSQVQLAQLSGINVATIRKYELGLRNPKAEQLEKIATALGLNVSIFLDFNIETAGDVLSLLFAIDDAVDLKLVKTENGVEMIFDHPVLKDFLQKWSDFKNAYTIEMDKISNIQDMDKRQEEIDRLNAMQEEYKLRMMGTTVGCHTVVKKDSGKKMVTVQDFL